MAKANCEYTVAKFPDYGRGEQGWRLELCTATNARVTRGVVGGQSFRDWFANRVREVPRQYLSSDLPVDL